MVASRWTVLPFLLVLLYSIWDYHNQYILYQVDEGADFRRVVIAPFDDYAVHFLVDDVKPELSRGSAAHVNAADPISARWKVSNVLGDVLVDFEGSTASWYVGSSSATVRGPHPEGLVVFPSGPGEFFRVSPLQPRILQVSIPSLGAFETRTVYLMLQGTRDDGYSFYVLYYVLALAVLGIIALTGVLLDVTRLVRRR